VESAATVDEPVTTPAAASVAVDPDLLDDFRRWLDQDAWQVDVAWSVIEPRGGCPTRAWRWIFLPTDQAAPAAPAPQTLSAASPQPTDRWSWVWRGDAADVPSDERTAGLAALAVCRTEPGRLGGNAAILLARLDPAVADDVTNSLRTTCESGGLSPQVVRAGMSIDTPPTDKPPVRVPIHTRCAAAEAWTAVLAAAGEPFETRLLPAGRLLQTPGLPDELRGTLWRSLSQWLPPDRLPALAETCAGLDQPAHRSSTLQRAAVEACVIAASRQWDRNEPAFVEDYWPRELERARRHSDPHLRRLYGRWLAFSRHPDALTVLTAQRRDTDPLVRDAALSSLGLLNQPAARTQLEQVAQRDGERDRVVAVEALAHWGSDAIEPFVTAESPAVRSAVARGLTHHSDPRAERLLHRLIGDPHPDVQTAALTTARSWPTSSAIPPLLEALRAGTLATRQSALTALRELTGEDPPVAIDAPPEDRAVAAQAWAEAHGWRFAPTRSETTNVTTPPATDAAATLSALQAVLEAKALPPGSDAYDRLLVVARPEDVPAIERMLLEQPSAAADSVRRELLPKLHEGYATLRDLEQSDVHRRREAAARLQRHARRHPLSAGLLRGLHQTLTHEQDQIVWQQCLEAIQSEGHDEAAQLALLALHHTWPDIRRLGVAYFAAHPTPEAAGWLLPLFRDSHRGVQLAAISAAGRCGNPVVLDGYPGSDEHAVMGLRPLLSASDHELRWTTLVTMATLRDDQAAAELIRQSYDPHPKVREQTARALGDTGDVRFVEPLIRWSWTEGADPVKQAILHSLDQLTPPEERPEMPAGLAQPPTIDDKIRQWAAWWERHPRRPGAGSPPTTAATEGRPKS
jgi:HEAT repeat protein